MISRHPLKALYANAFSNQEIDVNRLATFFQGTLGVPNIAWIHIIAELKAVKEKPRANLASLSRLYQLLHESGAVDEDTR